MASPSDEDKPRKASEVVLELERKLDLMVKIAAGTDTNTKLLLDRLNKICNLLESIDSKLDGGAMSSSDFSPEVPEKAVVSAPPIEVETAPLGSRRTARPETYPSEEERSSSKVIPIQQKVFDPAGKAVFMAEVEILNEDKSPAAKVRTTAGGKWQVPLPPGKYFVTILKRESGARKRMEYSGSFIVTNSDKPIELDPAKLV